MSESITHKLYSKARYAKEAAERELEKIENLSVSAINTLKDEAGKFYSEIHLAHKKEDLDASIHKALGDFKLVFGAEPNDPAPEGEGDEQKPADTGTKRARRGTGIDIKPHDKLYPARAGSKQAAIIDALVGGATIEDLQKVCVNKNGVPWTPGSIRSAFYWDINKKGYGVRTEMIGDDKVAKYFLVLPEGCDGPLPHKTPNAPAPASENGETSDAGAEAQGSGQPAGGEEGAGAAT